MHNQLHSNGSYKAKTLEGGGMHHACLCLGTMLYFLHFMKVDPQRSDLDLLDWRRSHHLERNAMYDVKNEQQRYD
jgi:hypothetical protein